MTTPKSLAFYKALTKLAVCGGRPHIKYAILGILIYIGVNCGQVQAQSMGISSSAITPDASSILELRTTSKGLLIPRMTTTERDAISSPATGLMIFNTTTGKFNFYNGSSWLAIFSGSTGVNSVTGTSNRISIGGTSADPTVDISSSYVGQSSITTLGTIATGTWNGATIGTTYGGTGVSSVTTSPTASSFAGWDANKNLSANNHIEGYSTTTTAAGTTTLTVASTFQQYFTGSSTQTVTMPVTSTLVNGQQFLITNLSSGTVTVQSSGANTIQAMAANTQLLLTVISTSGTGTASWSWTYNSLTNGGSAITALTGDITATGPGSAATTLATVNGNTGSFGSSTAIPSFTVNGKGLITAASTAAVVAPAGTLTGTTLASNVVTSSLTSVGTIGTGVWNGTVIGTAYGGTGVTSVTTSPLASSFAGWDANKNLSANNHIEGYTTTATAAGTTTLTVASAFQQYFTGSSTQTVTMPVTSTLVNGQRYIITNLSSGTVTVQSSGANTIQAMGANTQLLLTVISTSGTGTASWSWTYSSLTNGGSAITALTGDITATGPGSAAATLATVNGNTGSFGSSTAIPTFTVNGKGLITAASTAAVVAPAGTLTGTTLAANVVTSSLTSVGTIGTGVWNGTTIGTAYGGTGVTSVTTSPLASSFAGWDANKNLSANNHIEGYATTATAAGTTTLTVASAFQQYFTGSSTQTVTMPVTSTLVNGQQFLITNLSSGTVTVQSSGANAIQAMAANTQLLLTVISTSGTGTASWSWIYNSLTNGGSAITALTGDITATGPGSAAATLATVNGNTGSFGSSTAIPTFTVNGKGLITAASTNAVIAPAGTVTGTTLASNVVTSSLTTVGTISTGIWNGSIITSTYGGTGNGFTKFTGPATSEKTFTLPNASATILTDNAVVTAAQGGTGQTSFTTGDILYASSSTALSKLTAVAAGSFLRSAGTSTAPVWSTTTLPNSATTGDVLYASASNTYSNLAGVATGNALISGGTSTAPSWGKIGLTTHVSGTLPIANGGTNSTATPTDGGIVYGDGTSYQVTALGTTGQVLQSNGTGVPAWADGGTMMLSGVSNNTAVNNTTLFFPVVGGLAGAAADAQAGLRTLVSRSGTIKNLYVKISAAIAAGKTGTVTIYKNGVATSLVATLSVGPVSFTDLTHSFTVVAGDEIGVQVATTGNVKFSWAIDFTY